MNTSALRTAIFLATLLVVAVANAQSSVAEQTMEETIRMSTGKILGPSPLYEEEIPNSKASADHEYSTKWLGMEVIERVSHPTYTVYLPPPSRASGAAILIFPGGSYVDLSWDMEGRWIAAALQDRGIAGILVKYRTPSDETMVDKSIGPLQDAQQAILQVRRHAAVWGIDSNKIGVIGFSAGGHLASMLGTTFRTDLVPNPESVSLRPDFLILAYAITSFADGRVSEDIRKRLVGEHPTVQIINKFSSELQVTDATPPTLLLAASNDVVVPVDHALNFYRALREHGVPAEIVLFDRGQHGFFELSLEEWRAPVWAWLVRNGIGQTLTTTSFSRRFDSKEGTAAIFTQGRR